MTEDFYIKAIAALLPLTACMLVLQVNPYHALVIRGILGAVAALVYAMFGAADVALTEALVGTMLSITLYAVAVRSSLNMRVGVVENQARPEAEPLANVEQAAHESVFEPLYSSLRQLFSQYHLRLEPITYPNPTALQAALMAKEIHATVSVPEEAIELPHSSAIDKRSPYHIQTRVPRLYDIMKAELPTSLAHLTYVKPADFRQTETHPSEMKISNHIEAQP